MNLDMVSRAEGFLVVLLHFFFCISLVDGRDAFSRKVPAVQVELPWLGRLHNNLIPSMPSVAPNCWQGMQSSFQQISDFLSFIGKLTPPEIRPYLRVD